MANEYTSGQPEYWEPIGGEFFRFEAEGDTLQGQLIDRRFITVAAPGGGESTIGQYTILTGDGEIFFNGSFDLDAKMARIPDRAYVRVTRQGIDKTKRGFSVIRFLVETRRGEVSA